ncbi:Uncharacterised protein [Mycobacterium tuberculosis]|uniref:Uncharacterized protein n=1 Tax=Mycobacterium tuberculosis TaxID=1773 RepID=A0A654ZF77_MYCTX|nr:Uncharacterised protein [Mycobacterium tuberculosis]CFR78249.1 Uncharacterised protein [Mycobacterium tuberculosis]CFS09795.1 Uncharacterised protein [Mycobacterium tuberculosis]CKO79836.1 Uncharacterised protein [Mycobacterium tuberculosis]CKR23770.1 Uncharacterised protein [Mycobacterium tuberculosis]
MRPRAAASPWAATAIACDHEVGTSAPLGSPPSRIRGVVITSGWVAYVKAHRPLSQFHSSLTSGSSPASRRSTLPRRWSVRCAQPDAQCSQTLGLETKSNGRARNR